MIFTILAVIVIDPSMSKCIFIERNAGLISLLDTNNYNLHHRNKTSVKPLFPIVFFSPFYGSIDFHINKKYKKQTKISDLGGWKK